MSENTWIGKKYVDDSDENTQEKHEDNVYKSDLPKNARVITPNTMVTYEFKPERLNLYLDDNNKVKKVVKG